MNITARDKNAPWWLELKAELEARLVKLRRDNDRDLSAEQTAKLRGRIAEVNGFIESLGMGKPKPKIEAD